MKTIALLSLALLLSLPTAAQEEYSFREKYSVSTPARLDVSSYDGHIEIRPSQGNEIQVYYIARKNGKVITIDRKQLEQEVILEVVNDGSSLRISVKSRNESENWFADWKNRVSVSFRILTPTRTSCDLRTSDGNVSMEGLTANQRVRTSDGHLVFEGISGSIEGRTSDGNVRVLECRGSVEIGTSDGNMVLEKVNGDVLVSTSDGNIELQHIRGIVNAKTSDGNITFSELAGSLTAKTSDGSIRGNLIELKNELSLHTGDGNISISIPAGVGLDLDVRGESLSVPLKNFSGKSDNHSIVGKAHGGGVPVSLHTSEGHVTVSYQ